MASTAANFAQLPSGASNNVSPFRVAIKDEAIQELNTLLSLCKLAPLTYEALQGHKYGVPHDWLKKAKAVWMNEIDWYESRPFRGL